MEQPASPATVAADAEASAPAVDAAVERASGEQAAHDGGDEAPPPATATRRAAEADADSGAEGVQVPAAAAHAKAQAAAPEAPAAAEGEIPRLCTAARPAGGGLISAHFARQPPGVRVPPLPVRPAAASGAGGARPPRPPRPPRGPASAAPQPLPTALRERAGALASIGAAGCSFRFGQARSSAPLRVGVDAEAPVFAPVAFGRGYAPLDASMLPAPPPPPWANANAAGGAHRGASRRDATPSAGGAGGFHTPAGAGGPSAAALEPSLHRRHPPCTSAAGALAPAPPQSDDPARVFGALRAHYAALASRNCPALLAALTSAAAGAAHADVAELAAQALRRDALFAAPHALGAASDDEAAAAAEAAARRRRQQRWAGAEVALIIAGRKQLSVSPRRGAASCDTWPPRGAASPPADAPSPAPYCAGAVGDDNDDLDALFPLAGAAGRAPPAWRERQQEDDPLAELGISPPAWTAADARFVAAGGLTSPGADDDPAARKRHRKAQADAAGVGVGALRQRQR